MNKRGWTWTKDEEERSDYDEGRLDYLASRWSELHNAAEQRMFSRMSDDEEGRYDYDQEPCEHCSDGLQGVEFEGRPKAFLWSGRTHAQRSRVQLPARGLSE